MALHFEKVAVIWGGTKRAVEAWLNLSPDALHVHVGIIGWLAAAVATRRALDNPLPWALLLAAELINEFIDLNQPAGSIESNWPASQHDILNTMAMPTLVFAFLRARRWWTERRGGEVEVEAEA
ncbi:hypothetical protein [Sphingobium aquiterrae]|uniref:hypothetical protein n=1 Tax=Sphingobium aquiterrae TaxID=2038656 RepID=UPI003016A7EF